MKESNIFYSLNNNYKEMSDEGLVNASKSGDKNALEYLINKYKELVNMKVSKYFIIGAEKEDIIQEGLIGLYKAIKSYSGSSIWCESNVSNKLVSSSFSYADSFNDKYELSGICFCLFDDFIAVISCLSIHIFANVLNEFCLSPL